MLRGSLWIATVGLILLSTLPSGAGAHAQRTVKVSDGWVEMGEEGTALAGVTIENGTMYEVYLTAAESEVAGAVEFTQSSGGKLGVVKELAVPAFDRLEMAATGTHLVLRQLKRSVKPGDRIAIELQTDGGERIQVSAIVK